MSLAESLAEISQNSKRNSSPETLRIFEEAAAALVRAGIGDHALQEGDDFPSLTLRDHNSSEFEVATELEKGPAIVVFYRGGWCPYCNLELREYQSRLGDIKSIGGQLFAVSPQSPDSSLTTIEKNELTFPVLTDNQNGLAKALGVSFELTPAYQQMLASYGINLPERNANSGWLLPLPATYVVDTDGRIAFAHIDRNYEVRANPDAVIAALKRLSG